MNIKGNIEKHSNFNSKEIRTAVVFLPKEKTPVSLMTGYS